MKNIYQIEDLYFKYSNTNNTRWSFFSKKGTQEATESDKGVFELGPLNLNIPKGKLTAILGRSGSGKTTLLSIIGLLRQPAEGVVKINLNDTTISQLWKDNANLERFRSEHLGFALQKGELLPHLSLFENASLVSTYLKKEPAGIQQDLQGHFEALFEQEQKEERLGQVMHNKPSNVSQGQYQRGAIARALANNPSIILADEPTGNLDIHAGEKTMRIFQQIVRKDPAKSVVVVTHDRKLAIDFADTIIILKEGKLKSIYHQKLKDNSWDRNVPDEATLEINDIEVLKNHIGKDLD